MSASTDPELAVFLQHQCEDIRSSTCARASAIVLDDLTCSSGMEDWESIHFQSLLALRERLREDSGWVQPIPLSTGSGWIYLVGPIPRAEEAERRLEALVGEVALVRELQSKAGRLEVQVGSLKARLDAEVEERVMTERALQDSNEKLTEWVCELEQRNRDTSLLKEITDLIQACMNSKEADRVISDYLPRLFEAYSGAICVLDAAGKFVEQVSSWGDAQGLESVFLPEHCWSLRRSRLHCVKDSQSALRCSHVGGALPRWYLCVPLIAHGQAIGLLHINSKPRCVAGPADGTLDSPARTASDAPLNPFIQHLAETVAEQMGMALANLQLREALRTQAVRDPLTGLYNRRYMEESLAREVRRAQRSRGSFGCLMMDLDNFKSFNDTFGHGVGDLVLRQVGAFLLNALRASDIVCRYGGEEFTVILPDASLDVTRRRAEEIRIGLSKLRLEHHPEKLAPTVSIGVAALPDHGQDAESVLHAADAALYQAKREGRNRVCLGEFPPCEAR